MFKLDKSLLAKLGLADLPPSSANDLLAWIYETLELRVGLSFAERMTNEELDEFETFMDADDEKGALKWLEQHFPDYKTVVANQLEQLEHELRRHRHRVRDILLNRTYQPSIAADV